MAVTMKLHTPKRQDEIFQPSFVVLGKLSTPPSKTPSRPKKSASKPLARQESDSLLEEQVRGQSGTKQD